MSDIGEMTGNGRRWRLPGRANQMAVPAAAPDGLQSYMVAGEAQRLPPGFRRSLFTAAHVEQLGKRHSKPVFNKRFYPDLSASA